MRIFSIILADDEQQILYGMKKGIEWEKLGFRVAGVAQNGKEALELMEEVHPDLVISDIKMPFMDGLELAKHIHEDYMNTKVILFSGWDELIRVATKYPNIAKDYFYNTKHQTVEIIKLNGSIELAPIVGLSEVIVDIVETGSTLRENGLEVLEEVCPLSARMIVNPVSMRMESARIKDLLTRLREQV